MGVAQRITKPPTLCGRCPTNILNACQLDANDGTGPFRWASVRVRKPAAGPGEDPVLGCVTNVSENWQCCAEDGRRPPGVGFQESASNRPELLRSKGVVVNVRGKGVRRGRQVSVEKMSESELSDDASSRI